MCGKGRRCRALQETPGGKKGDKGGEPEVPEYPEFPDPLLPPFPISVQMAAAECLQVSAATVFSPSERIGWLGSAWRPAPRTTSSRSWLAVA